MENYFGSHLVIRLFMKVDEHIIIFKIVYYSFGFIVKCFITGFQHVKFNAFQRGCAICHELNNALGHGY